MEVLSNFSLNTLFSNFLPDEPSYDASSSFSQFVHEYLNPFELSLYTWLAFVVFKVVAQGMLELTLEYGLAAVGVPKLPSRVPEPIMKGLEQLQLKDYLYLGINQVIETAFMFELFSFVLFDSRIYRGIPDTFFLMLLTVLAPTYLILYLDDLVYYFFHRTMHHPAIYPYTHKHHHRQPLPKRGYLDAANETPFEQVGGLTCVWTTFSVVVYAYNALLGVKINALTFVMFLSAYATMAFLNHTDLDVRVGWLGMGYEVRAHEMHHRFGRCNYSQNTMMWDKLLNTFKEYKSGH